MHGVVAPHVVLAKKADASQALPRATPVEAEASPLAGFSEFGRGRRRPRRRVEHAVPPPRTTATPRATACPKCRTIGTPHPLFADGLCCEYCDQQATEAMTWPCGHPSCRECYERWAMSAALVLV